MSCQHVCDQELYCAGEEAVVNQKGVPGIWRCSICTYDNDETMTYCEICGVLRYPPTKSGNSIDKTSGNAVFKLHFVPTHLHFYFILLVLQARMPLQSSDFIFARRMINCVLAEESRTSVSNLQWFCTY